MKGEFNKQRLLLLFFLTGLAGFVVGAAIQPNHIQLAIISVAVGLLVCGVGLPWAAEIPLDKRKRRL